MGPVGAGPSTSYSALRAQRYEAPPPPPPPPPQPQAQRAWTPPNSRDTFEYSPKSDAMRGASPASSTRTSAQREQMEKQAALGLKFGESELAASKSSGQGKAGFLGRVENLIDRATFPAEKKQRAAELEQRLPQLRKFKAEYETAKKQGASPAELDAKLDKYAAASKKTLGSARDSVQSENDQLVKTGDNLKTAADVSAVVRDTSLTTLATLASGGSSLAVTTGVVLGGAAVKTGSQEAALRTEGKGRDLKGIATGFGKNTLDLGASAAGGYGSKLIKGAVEAEKIGTGTATLAKAGVKVATGVAKRAAAEKSDDPEKPTPRALDRKAIAGDLIKSVTGDLADKATSKVGSVAAEGVKSMVTGAVKRAGEGKPIFDRKEMTADGVKGLVEGTVGKTVGKKIEGMGGAPKVFVGSATGAATSVTAKVAENAITGKPLKAGLSEAATEGTFNAVSEAAKPPKKE